MGEFKNMLVKDLSNDIFARLQVEHLGEHGSCQEYGAIPCGDKILDSYEPTSTLDRCMKFTKGLGRITRSQLFIKYIFDNNLVPKKFRAHFKSYTGPYRDGKNDNRIAVGLPFVKWLIEKYGVKVKAKPKMLRLDCEENPPRTSGYSSYTSCMETSYIRSAIYYIGDVVASNEAFRWFRHESAGLFERLNMPHGSTTKLSASDEEYIEFDKKDCISAEKALDAFMAEVLNSLPEANRGNSMSCKPVRTGKRVRPSKPPSILPAAKSD